MQYVDSLLDLIGHTPLLRLSRTLDAPLGQGEEGPMVLAKVEYLNPGGSVKDRIATRMIEAAEASGELQPGGIIVEPTSGNTGVGLAMVAQAKGYKCVFVCPDKVSEDKRNVLRAYGAEVVVCPTAVAPEHPDSYYNVSDRLASQPGAWKPDQYSNPNNPRSHYETTGPEIWEQTEGRITHFVTGMGTGGTISGVGRYLKEQNPDIQVVGADPAGSVYSGGTGRPYLVEGVGEDFWPDTYDRGVADRVGPQPQRVDRARHDLCDVLAARPRPDADREARQRGGRTRPQRATGHQVLHDRARVVLELRDPLPGQSLDGLQAATVEQPEEGEETRSVGEHHVGSADDGQSSRVTTHDVGSREEDGPQRHDRHLAGLDGCGPAGVHSAHGGIQGAGRARAGLPRVCLPLRT